MDRDRTDGHAKRASTQKFVARERPPRVTLTYEVETYGATGSRELPFVVGVLADLSGQRAEPNPGLADLRFIEIDLDNFDDVMARLRPRIAFTVANLLGAEGERLAIELSFARLQDFEPEAVARQIPALSAMLERDDSDGHASLSAQLGQVLHAQPFQRLEATWRGLNYLVTQTEAGPMLELRVLDVSKADLARDMQRAIAFDQSVLFKKVYEQEYGTYGGTPYGLLVGDYAFGHDARDMALLQGVAAVAATAHAPFIAAASAGMFNLEGFSDLHAPRDIGKIFDTAEYALWRTFREMDCARYAALTLPRILLRHPYQRGFGEHGSWFDEPLDGASDLLWGNPAYALAACITNAFAKYGWCAAIRGVEGGGLVEGLPCVPAAGDDGGSAAKAVTDIRMTDRREKELADLGFVPLLAFKGTDLAAFFSMQTCCQPGQYDMEAASANARLATQLQYVLTASRFVHYLRSMARDRIGSFHTLQSYEEYLNRWLGQYVLDEDGSPANKAQRPLREARVELEQTPGKPGTYRAVIFLRPHFQLDELSVSMRLVAELPVPAL